MKLNRDKIKDNVSAACLKAFAERRTINDMLAVGLMAMVDSICDELESPTTQKVKKVA